MESLKSLIVEEIRQQLEVKLKDLQSIVDAGRTSRDSSTKSSAGDKHETSRALMQNEMDQNKRVLAEALAIKRDFVQIDFEKVHDSVQAGSLVQTQKGYFLICIGIGRIQVSGKEVFAISLASPIGRALHGAKVGDRVSLREEAIEILSIY